MQLNINNDYHVRFAGALPGKISIWSAMMIALIIFVSLTECFAETQSEAGSKNKWVGTWSTSPQLVEIGNNPPSPGLSNNTIRQIVHVSIGGDTLRLRLTNEFSKNPVKINSAHISVSSGGGAIDTTTDTQIFFGGTGEVTLEAGTAVNSDPFQFTLQPVCDVAITIYFGETSPDVTGHPGSRTTSYILTGNAVTNENFSGAVTTDHWYIINTLDVLAPDTSYAVAILGNSITDGRGSGTNQQNRWPDELSRRFQSHAETRHIAVLNSGIGGNCVLGACLGPSALSRFSRDILEQNGVKWAIILEGINDIGNAWGSGVGNNLIEAYKQMIQSAHAKGIFVFGATLLPMKGNSYYSASHEAERQTVNNWIRYGGMFDGVIDMDKALRNPKDTLSLRPEADTGDHLHPNETGHRMMAEAVDLNLFAGTDSVSYSDASKSFYYEAECATVGSNWEILPDNLASNRKYAVVKAGLQSLNSPPAGNEGGIVLPFTADTSGYFFVYARMDCPTANDDSYWVKIDEADYQMMNNLTTGGWEWKKLNGYNLTKGQHTLTIAYREDGAKLDKICVTNSSYPPVGMGEQAINLCTPTGNEKSDKIPDGYGLEQNYPNPFNPETTIKYSIPMVVETPYRTSLRTVSLTIYDLLGREIKTLVNENKAPGNYEVGFNAGDLSSGIYFYRLEAGGFSAFRKMMLLK